MIIKLVHHNIMLTLYHFFGIENVIYPNECLEVQKNVFVFYQHGIPGSEVHRDGRFPFRTLWINPFKVECYNWIRAGRNG